MPARTTSSSSPATFGAGLDPSTRRRDRNPTLFGTGKWNRVLIDATINLDFEPEANYDGNRYPPMVRPATEDWERVERRWHEYGFKQRMAKYPMGVLTPADRLRRPDLHCRLARLADPEMPETIAPTALLIDRHLGTPVEHKTALVVDGVPVSYGELAEHVAAVSAASLRTASCGKTASSVRHRQPRLRARCGSARCASAPSRPSSPISTRRPDLLYFLRDTAARFLFIDAEQTAEAR